MANYCCVRGCNNNSQKNHKLSYFSIPMDSIRQLQWLENIERLDLMVLEQIKVKNRWVCSEHFESRMFAGLGRNKLKKNAIPTIIKKVHLDSSTSKVPTASRISGYISILTPPLVTSERR
ncbi:hypothetical protein ABEB36_014941 [Hypothenemus hampei]|uniref:THAP-type domain-containing protein n=1 Tax=Hypothenemus hampei TaxID=57062 RepID=A0ABD1E2A1_HYPHA